LWRIDKYLIKSSPNLVSSNKIYKRGEFPILMDSSVLEGIGLSKNEITVFLKMLNVGESKAGHIISKTGLQSSAVYNAINSLISKGLVSYIKKGNVKYYKAANPETIVNYLDNKKEEYLKVLPELQGLVSETIENVEFYKSYRGIKTLIAELLNGAKKNNIYRFFSIEDEKEYRLAAEKVYKLQKPIRNQMKIKTKGIYSEKTRKITRGGSITFKRYLSAPLPPNTQMLNNKVAIISWKGEQPSGILIRSKDIYETYVNFFEHMWETVAKK
jgi:sugar-specific transcriptional regulator TrmB